MDLGYTLERRRTALHLDARQRAEDVEHLVSALTERGVTVRQSNPAVTDIGKLAIALVDAATIIIGTPTIHVGPHPAVFYAAYRPMP